MKYIKKKFVDEDGAIVSFWSTDDNVLCEDGKTLRENLNDITKEDQRKVVNYGINKFNLYNELIYGFNFFGHFNIHDQDDMWWEKYVKLRIGFQITEQNSIILYATSLPMEQ